MNKWISILLAASLLFGLAARQSAAQEGAYPSKPVRLLVASGGSDAVGRVLATKMGEAWGKPVLADIRSGASGLITLDALAQSPADGYTMAMVTLSQMLSTLENKRRLLATEFDPVTFVGSTPFAIVINAAVPANTLDEWIAYVKAQPPGKLAYASSGLYASAHVCMEEFNSRAGLNMLHVPYKTSTAALVGVMGGEVLAQCSAAANAVPLGKSGKLKLIGSTYKEPSELLPGVPPIATRFPGFEVQGWYGVVAPLNTPKDLTAKISAEFVKNIKAPDLQKLFANMGIRPEGTTPERFSVILREETQRWGKIIEAGSKNP